MINCCSEKCNENLLLQSGGIIKGSGITKRVLAKPQKMFRCGTINYFPQDVWYMKNSQTLQFLFKNFIEIKSNNCFKTKHLYIHMYRDGIYQFLNKMKIIKIKYLVDDINQTIIYDILTTNKPISLIIKDLNLKKSIIIYTICTIHKKNIQWIQIHFIKKKLLQYFDKCLFEWNDCMYFL